MKKIVFLICIFLASSMSVDASDDVTECDAFNLTITSEKIDRRMVINVVSNGETPFKTVIKDEHIKYYLNDYTCTVDSIILYGYVNNEESETYYDSMIIVLNSIGLITHQIISDHEELEEIVGLYQLTDMYLSISSHTLEVGGEYEVQHEEVTFYDLEFQVIDSFILEHDIKRHKQENGMVLIDYDYKDLYDIGYTNTGIEITNQTELLIEESYIASMELEFINKAWLNGETKENGLFIDYPGNYRLEYNQLVYEFIVEAKIDYIESETIYNEPVTPHISSGNCLLNGELYESGTTISEPGFYSLIVQGVNGYTKETTFTILPDISGIINGHSYKDSVIISFEGEGYLNNKQVDSPLSLDEEGEYVLRIKGAGGYLDTYEFSIVDQVNNNSLADFIKNIDIFLVIITLIGGIIILKKK